MSGEGFPSMLLAAKPGLGLICQWARPDGTNEPRNSHSNSYAPKLSSFIGMGSGWDSSSYVKKSFGLTACIPSPVETSEYHQKAPHISPEDNNGKNALGRNGKVHINISTKKSSYDQGDLGQAVRHLFSLNNLSWVLFKNVGISFLWRSNLYIIQLLDHDQAVIDADALGQERPPKPPAPKLKPEILTGLWMSAREMMVKSVRLGYSFVAKFCLHSPQPYLRDPYKWAKTAVVGSKPHAHKCLEYLPIYLRGNCFAYAAEGTVSILLCYWSIIWRNAPVREKLASAATWTGFHIIRCTSLLLAISGIAALGSLAIDESRTKALVSLPELVLNIQIGTLLTALLL